MKLLERDELLARLQEQLRLAVAGPGMLVFIEGEAGIGKTSLLRAFASKQSRELPLFWGACDALQTPRPLGPLHDIAAVAGGELASALEAEADRVRVFAAFLQMLAYAPCVVLLEDLHWADEATLDLLRYISRRISRTRALLVATFRNDEIGPSHPLRMVLGDLATSGVVRLMPEPLSVNAVRTLAGNRENVNVPELHRRTCGNPFFVTEALAAGGDGVPETVRDAVLTRAARLRPSARAVLDAAAVAGPRVEPWLLQDLAAAESSSVDECLASGVLSVQEGMFAFRHELARQAVLQALTPTRLLSLHRLVVQALQSPVAPAPDYARLAHHAEEAGLSESVLRYAPTAAIEAAAKGAHRQAAQQYARALRHVSVSPGQRAPLLQDYSEECQHSGLLEEAINARQNAADLWRDSGNPDRQAIALARLGHLLVLAGRNAAGEAAVRKAIDLVGPNAETAVTVGVRRWAAHLRMLDRDVDEAIREGTLAMEGAEALSDRDAQLHCLNTIGSAMIVGDRVTEGREYLEKSLALAEKMRSDAGIASALGNLGSACGEVYRFDLAEGYLRRGMEICTDRDMDSWRLYVLAWMALVHLYLGRWNESAEAAHAVLADRRSSGIARITALNALGKLRARRGDPAVWDALNEARELAGNTGTLQRMAPMQAARAEAAWMDGRAADGHADAAAGAELAARKRHVWFTSELLFSCQRATGAVPMAIPDFCSRNPFALEAAGQWREAADAWRSLRCPFETARSLAEGDETAQKEALAIFESLGARPMGERVRHKLRAAGVRGLSRGPRESTKNHPAGLTSKEVAVLVLLAQGLRNKEIAQRLSRSARTIDHHLAAIFTKLGVNTRAEAVSAAHRLGVIVKTGTDRAGT
jgi:DNA-binding CsgD family transcriptional regulator/tetratricopeptide (TPR) repeat protein